MRQPSLIRRLQSFFSPRPTSVRRGRGLRMEALEDRLVLTSTLYVDFGDRFGSGLTGTLSDLMTRTHSGNPAVNGPDLIQLGYAATDTFTTIGFNATNSGNDAQDRADMMAMIRRYYAPFDITVVELTAQFQTVNGVQVRGVSTLDEISDLLGANESATKNNDTYCIVGLTTLGPNNDNPALSGLLGISNAPDIITASNQTDGTVMYFLSGLNSPFDTNTLHAKVIAHEAGHSFGMRHSLTGLVPAGASPVIPESEIMSYFSIDGLVNFSRFPMVGGEDFGPPITFNTNPNLLNSGQGQNTIYDQLKVDSSIGASNMEYVTGTGAHDIITITQVSSTQALVKVEPFGDTAYTAGLPVPKIGGTSFSYNITLSPTLPIRVDGGPGSDRFVIDARLGSQVTIYGMEGDDQLVVDGHSALSAIYTAGTNQLNGLDSNPDLRGTITVGTTTINFQEFETTGGVTVRDVETFTFRTPGGIDSLNVSANANNDPTIQGFVNSGTSFVPVSARNVMNFVIDAGNNDGPTDSDSIQFTASLSQSVGVKNLTFITGEGDDTFKITASDLTLPVAGGKITFDAGLGDDKLSAIVADLTLPSGGVTFLGGDGNDNLQVSTNSLTFATNGVGFTFDGGAGNDKGSIAINGAVTLPTAAFQFTGGDGNDVLAMLIGGLTLAQNSVVFDGGVGNDAFQLLTTTMSLATGATGPGLSFDGNVGDDLFGINATGALTVPADAFLFNAIDGNDTLAISAASLTLTAGAGGGFLFNGDLGDDSFSLTATNDLNLASSVTFNGGEGNDNLTLTAAIINITSGGPGVTFTGGLDDDTASLTSTSALTVPANTLLFDDNEGNDSFTVSAAGLTLATNAFTFNGGIGDDSLKLTSTTSISLGANPFTFVPGVGNDALALESFTLTLTGGANPLAFDGADGNDTLSLLVTSSLILQANALRFTGGNDADSLVVTAGTLSMAAGSLTFDAGNGNDSLSLGVSGALTLPAGAFTYTAGAGNDTLSVASASLTLVTGAGGAGLAFDGGTGDDKLSLGVVGALTVPAGGVVFTGGAGNDTLEVAFGTFVLGSGGTGSAFRFDGGADNDTLTLKSTSDLVLPARAFRFDGGDGGETFEIEAPTLTLGAGGSNLVFEGATGDDALLLKVGTLTLPPGGLIFNGGDGNDRLDAAFSALTLPNNAAGIGMTFNGGNGIDTLEASNSTGRTFTVTGLNTGNMNSRLAFVGVESLISGDAPDQFIFQPAGRLTGLIDGKGGADILNLATVPNISATLSPAGAIGGFNGAIAGAMNAQVRSINRIVASVAGRDTLQGTAGGGNWTLGPTGGTYTSSDGETLPFSGFEIFRGGLGADVMNVTLIPPSGITFDGAGGSDTLKIAGTAGVDTFTLNAASVVVNGRVVAFANLEKMDLRGGAGNDRFTSAAAGLRVGAVDLRGEAGADTFLLTASVTTQFSVMGDGPTRTPGDNLVLNRGGAALIGGKPARGVTAGRLSVLGRIPIVFTGIESFSDGGSQFLPR